MRPFVSCYPAQIASLDLPQQRQRLVGHYLLNWFGGQICHPAGDRSVPHFDYSFRSANLRSAPMSPRLPLSLKLTKQWPIRRVMIAVVVAAVTNNVKEI